MKFSIAVLLAFAASAVAQDLASAGSLAKVTELLDGLKSDVITEGQEEAQAYDKFACWCKETTETVSEEVKAGIEDINANAAAIEQCKATIEAAKTKLAEKQAALAAEHERFKMETKTWEAYKALHMETVGDLGTALEAIAEVQAMLKNANSFLETHKSMLSFPAIANSPILVAMLQGPDKEGEYEDTLTGGEVMGLLDDFKGKLTTEKEARETEYTKRKEAFHEEWKKNEEETDPANITDIEDEIAGVNDEIAQEETAMGEAQTKMAGNQMTLADDQTYLKKATEQCETKARIWDQRSALRAEEVQMLAQAVGILKGINDEGFFFIQTGLHPVKKALHKAQAKKAIRKAKAEEIEAAKPKEAQKLHETPTPEMDDVPTPRITAFARATAHTMQESVIEGEYRVWRDAKGRVMARSWIGNTAAGRESMAREKTKAALLQVKGLEHIAAEVARDPFVRVRKTINDMIERLMQEAKDEATQHGWCQTELAKVAKTIEFEKPRSLKYSARIVELESDMAQLSDEIEELKGNGDDKDGKIKEAQDALTEAQEARTTDKELNEKSVKDAEKAIDAVGQALVLLQGFYTKAGAQGGQKVALKKEVDGPEGREFSKEGETTQYGGAQDSAQNILGLLEVVKSKYETELAEVKQNEKESTSEFNALKADLSSKIAGMQKTQQLKEQEFDKAKGEHTSNDEKLKSTLAMIDAALKTQAKLRPACLNKGPTAAERKEQIEGQISALESALQALGNA